MNSLVSIIVPCYNQAQYLTEALDSVLAQTYHYWECIIVDDGSNDNTEKIAKIYCGKDNRFKYYYKDNGGPSSARNFGLKLAKGEYIQLLDSDDIIDSRKLDIQLNNFKENINLCISISSYYLFNKNKIYHTSKDSWNNIISTDFRYDILFRWDRNFSIPIHTALFKSNFIGNLQFNEQILAQEDWFFWIEISLNFPIVEYVNQELAFYRYYPTSRSNDIMRMKINTVKVYFIVADMLNQNEKEAFIFRIGEDIGKESLSKETLEKELARIQESKAYKLGKFLLKPIVALKNKFLKN